MFCRSGASSSYYCEQVWPMLWATALAPLEYMRQPQRNGRKECRFKFPNFHYTRNTLQDHSQFRTLKIHHTPLPRRHMLKMIQQIAPSTYAPPSSSPSSVLGQFLQQSPNPTTGQRGNIINMASVLGIVAHTHGAAYDASKAAIIHLSKSIALEYAEDKIRCNAICPSFVHTALTKPYFDQPVYERRMKRAVPLWRDSGAQDVAHAAVFLASGVEAGWITGAALPVDGGTIIQ